MRSEAQWNELNCQVLRVHARVRGIVQWKQNKKTFIEELMGWDKANGIRNAAKKDREANDALGERGENEDVSTTTSGRGIKRPGSPTTSGQSPKRVNTGETTVSGRSGDSPLTQTLPSKPRGRSTNNKPPHRPSGRETTSSKPPAMANETENVQSAPNPDDDPSSDGSSSAASNAESPKDDNNENSYGDVTQENRDINATHHVYEEVYSETEEEEQNTPINALGGPEREKRRRRQRERAGQPEPKGWDGTSNRPKKWSW